MNPIHLERNISKATWARDFKFGTQLCMGTGMPSGRTNNSVESGRGLGHVTPTILAVRSAILASSDSLASCYLLFLTLRSLLPRV